LLFALWSLERKLVKPAALSPEGIATVPRRCVTLKLSLVRVRISGQSQTIQSIPSQFAKPIATPAILLKIGRLATKLQS
jgi:hypothetical protein